MYYWKLTELKDRSQHCNKRIDGIAQKNGETWDEREEEIQELLLDRLDLDDIEIEWAPGAYEEPNRTSTIES